MKKKRMGVEAWVLAVRPDALKTAMSDMTLRTTNAIHSKRSPFIKVIFFKAVVFCRVLRGGQGVELEVVDLACEAFAHFLDVFAALDSG